MTKSRLTKTSDEERRNITQPKVDGKSKINMVRKRVSLGNDKSVASVMALNCPCLRW